jgi:hypothetical protein
VKTTGERKVLKSIFELWLDRELPEPLKTRIDSFSCQGKTFVEWVFKSGFYIGKHIKEIREDLGIEE